MLTVGVVDMMKTVEILNSIYKGSEDRKIIPLSQQDSAEGYFDILIMNKNSGPMNVSSGVALINSDEKYAYRAFRSKGKRIITYGINNKSCVTTSSISDGSVLLCIQRGISTLSGARLLQQEFSIPAKNAKDNIYSILSAATAALLDDVTPDKICAALTEELV